MLESGVCHLHDFIVGSQAVSFNDDRPSFAFGCIQQRSELFERNFLVSEINRRSCAADDTDDLLIRLRAKREARKWERNGNTRLQNKIRTEQQKENQEKRDIDKPKEDEPGEVIFFRPAELHSRVTVGCRSNELLIYESKRPSDWTDSSGWKLMMPLSGRLSVSMWTISIPARSMSCSMVFTREER